LSVQFPPPSREEKIALVKLLLKIKELTPIHCIFKCDYAGVLDDANVCFNPEIYSKEPQALIVDFLTLRCRHIEQMNRIQVVEKNER